MRYGTALSGKSLALQAMYLQSLNLPGARTTIPGGNRLEYAFEVTPFPGARTYRCRIALNRGGSSPKAFVLSPNLKELADGKKLPHIYQHDGKSSCLCLYFPDDKDWSPDMLLAETFVAWTIEWLRFFELWLVDGEWRGGGRHPGP
jgi:hypothetical protein